MAYVYAEAEALDKKPVVGTRQCVALIQAYTKAPSTSLWKEGERVMGSKAIAKGTVIATFVNGKYLSLPSGNHAAFYLSQDVAGIWVVDQWKSESKTTIDKRHIRGKGKKPDGTFIDPSNNADAFSVVE